MTYNEYIKQLYDSGTHAEELLNNEDFFRMYQHNLKCRQAFKYHLWITAGLHELRKERLSKDFVFTVLAKTRSQKQRQTRKWIAGFAAGFAGFLILSAFAVIFNIYMAPLLWLTDTVAMLFDFQQLRRLENLAIQAQPPLQGA